MELEDLKSTWKNIAPPKKSEDEIRLMLQENKHPVLKEIKKQMILEVIIWMVFLTVYYNMFDGAEKPFLINLVLVLTVLIPIIHNLYAYHLHRNLVNQSNFKDALKRFISGVKTYALLSIATRIVFSAGLLFFFTYRIQFNSAKYYALAIIILLFLIQMLTLSIIWKKRIKNLNQTLTELD